MSLANVLTAAFERVAAEFNTLRTEIVDSWSTPSELLSGTANRVVAVDALHSAIAHVVGPSHSSTVTLDGTAGLNRRLASVTSNFALAFSPDVPDGWSVDIRVPTSSGGPYLMQFPTGSVLLGEAWTGTRQISLASSSVYLVTVKRAHDGTSGYYLVSYIKEGA